MLINSTKNLILKQKMRAFSVPLKRTSSTVIFDTLQNYKVYKFLTVYKKEPGFRINQNPVSSYYY
jgi:hypothetical protein